jgi:hypothetical protein
MRESKELRMGRTAVVNARVEAHDDLAPDNGLRCGAGSGWRPAGWSVSRWAVSFMNMTGRELPHDPSRPTQVVSERARPVPS